MGVKDSIHFIDHTPFLQSQDRPTLYQESCRVCRKFRHFRGEVELKKKDLFSKVTSDVIASTAFDIQVSSLKGPNNEFFTNGKGLTQFNIWQIIKSRKH
ncbi:hypothetical protein BDFB_008161 [Asbolus verrucosus]|uniref:Uncharacterized protein n=1 Tax=Asbolus verrucosus TaxID=1661398 RepID=A0A482W1I4_ASBVE|nr:hypothetical protein BDFB_008161 [Asbolus verrucosus]